MVRQSCNEHNFNSRQFNESIIVRGETKVRLEGGELFKWRGGKKQERT